MNQFNLMNSRWNFKKTDWNTSSSVIELGENFKLIICLISKIKT